MRRAARRDENEPSIVEAARKVGFKVFYTNELGDLIVQWAGLTELWEVKTEAGKLTEAQLRRKQAGLVARVVRTIDDVLEAKRHLIRILQGKVNAIPES